jgi:hypothetical protein
MTTFAGVDHLSLSATDLDVRERFDTDVLDVARDELGTRAREHLLAGGESTADLPGAVR